jgi:hypothetical protein
MKKCLLGLALLAGLSSVSRNAAAESPVNGPLLADALTFVVLSTLDAGLTAVDVSFWAQHRWAPVPYGILEFMAGTAQFGGCLDSALSTRPGADPTPAAFGAALGAVFMAHGLMAIVRPGSHTEAPPPPAPVTVAPLALSDVARMSVPGLAVLGRF